MDPLVQVVQDTVGRHDTMAVRNRFSPLSLLILNAGMAATGNRRTTSGMDLNFAVNHLGHFLLTELLRDHLAPHSRVITVASWRITAAGWTWPGVSDAGERILAVVGLRALQAGQCDAQFCAGAADHRPQHRSQLPASGRHPVEPAAAVAGLAAETAAR